MTEYEDLAFLDTGETPAAPTGLRSEVKARGRRKQLGRRLAAGTPVALALVAIAVVAVAVARPDHAAGPATIQPVAPTGVATPSPGGGSAATSPAAPALPALAPARTSLVAAAHTSSVVAVVVPAAVEGLSFDQAGHLTFWRLTAGSSWARTGTTTYPVLSQPGETPDTSATGALLTGMMHATYLVRGTFTGDGTGNVVAYTDGAAGWGRLVPAGARSLVTTEAAATDNSTPGIVRDASLAGGRLLTSAGNAQFDDAEAGLYPLAQTWSWTGSGFAQATTNAFVAAAVAAPVAVNVTTDGCPQDGTVSGELTAQQPADPTSPSGLATVPLRYVGSAGFTPCMLVAAADVPMTIEVSSSHGDRWITAPAWLLESSAPMTTADVTSGLQRWVIPTADGVTGVLSDLGSPSLAGAGTPTHVQIVVRDGAVTAIALTPAS